MTTLMPTQSSSALHDSHTTSRRWLRWLKRSALGLLLLLATLVALGASYQALATARDARTFPPPGQLVDVGGYKLHIHCLGTGTPTVITENGLGGSSPDWSLVQPAVSQQTRICTYDRAGSGWSEVGPTPRTSQQIATELHTLLINANLPGPYVLAGHSAGGLHAQVYASQHPEEVAGLVLVDPTPARAIMRFSPEQRQAVLPNLTQAPLLRALEFVGLLRLLPLSGDEVLDGLPVENQAQIQAHRLQNGAMTTMLAEAASLETSIQQTVDAIPLPPDRPLIIVWHGIPAEPVELEPQARAAMEELLQQSHNGKLMVAEQSGHAITLERPDVVIAAIEQVIAAVRTSSTLQQ